MAGYAGKNDQQKLLSKLYGQLCYRFSRHEVWQDAVWMFASAISNSVDRWHFEEREKYYMNIIQKYDEKERQVFPQLFGAIINGMEEHPDCDFLGELYMELELGNSRAGQFFTPYNLCEAMAEITIDFDRMKGEIDRFGYVTVNDCACGAGAMLVAATEAMKKRGVNYQTQAFFVGQDLDPTVALMCYIQLSLKGCAGYVHIGDSLMEPMTCETLYGDRGANTWYTPMWFHSVWQGRMIARAMDRLSITKAQGPEPAATVNLVESTRRRNAGQLMFDLGG